MSGLEEVLAAGVLMGVPVALSAFFIGRNARESARRFDAFAVDMTSRRFPLRAGSSPSSWSARSEVLGAPVAIEPYTVQHGSGKHSRIESLTAIRVEAATTMPRAGIYLAASVPLTELGAMRELSLPPDLAAKYRAFGEGADEGSPWRTAEARELLLAVGSPRSITTTSGALVLVLEGHPASASLLVRAAELLAAMHARRSASPASPLAKDEGEGSAWLVPAMMPIFVSIFLGLPIACAPPVLDLASPIACERGHVVNRHTNKNPLECVDQGTHVEYAHLIPVLLGMNISYYPLMFASALWAALRVAKQGKKRESDARPSSAYR